VYPCFGRCAPASIPLQVVVVFQATSLDLNDCGGLNTALTG
jgi:hypothetical protein